MADPLRPTLSERRSAVVAKLAIGADPEHFDITCKRIEDAQRQSDLFIAGAAV